MSANGTALTGTRQPGPRDPARGYRRIVWLLMLLVIVPSSVLLTLGIILLVGRGADLNLILGILIVVGCGVLATGTTLVWVFLAKEQSLSQLQTDFVSKVSHELKTPLTSIRLFVDTLKLKRTKDPAQVDECLELLARETERLTERIDQLLEWGRMEAGRKTYDLRPDSMAEVVKEAIAHCVPLQLQGDADVEVEVEPGVPNVGIDRPAMVAAVLNLLSNAYKYGGRPRRIAVDVAKGGDDTVRVSVKDNGDGIPREDHKRIFQKFYRRDDRLSRMSEGSGLGLAIVSHVARGHGGHVELQSEQGKGSTFTLVLPALPHPPAEDA